MANPDLKTTHTSAVVIGVALIVAVFVYAGFAELINQGIIEFGEPFIDRNDDAYVYTRYGVLAAAVITFALIYPVRSIVRNAIRSETPGPKLFTAQVTAYAMSESLAIYGLILYLMAQNIWDIYLFCGMSLLSFIIFFPRYDRWEEWARSRQAR